MADKKEVAMENHRLLKKSSWVAGPSEQEIEVTVGLSCGKSMNIQDITFAHTIGNVQDWLEHTTGIKPEDQILRFPGGNLVPKGVSSVALWRIEPPLTAEKSFVLDNKLEDEFVSALYEHQGGAASAHGLYDAFEDINLERFAKDEYPAMKAKKKLISDAKAEGKRSEAEAKKAENLAIMIEAEAPSPPSRVIIEDGNHSMPPQNTTGGMKTSALCGLPNLTVANLKDVLGLLDIDADDYKFENKGKMASFVYDSIAHLVKSNKKLNKKVAQLKREIQDLEDNL